MTGIEDLWDLAELGGKSDEIGVIKNYEVIKQALLNGISYGGEDDYDEDEFLLELIGHHTEHKMYERVIEIEEILEQKYPNIFEYKATSLYQDLIKYWFFHGNVEKIATSIDKINDVYGYDSDNFIEICHKLLYFGEIDLLEKLIKRLYKKLVKGLILDPEDLNELIALFTYTKMGQAELEYINGKTPDLQKLSKSLKSFNSTLKKDSFSQKLSAIDGNFFTSENIEAAQNKEKIKEIQMLFNQYAVQKNIPLPLANLMGYKLLQYWSDGYNKYRNYYRCQPQTFSTFIQDEMEFMDFDNHKPIALLYFSTYFFDFLLANKLFSEEEHYDFQMIHANLRAKYYKQDFYELWSFGFVHSWEKPDSWSDEVWQKEQELFKETYAYVRRRDENIEEEILSKYEMLLPPKEERDIKKYELGEPTPFERVQNINTGLSNLSNQMPSTPIDPVKKKPKIGRNEKITVRYTDGKVVKNVKYKKVMKDIDSGKCEII